MVNKEKLQLILGRLQARSENSYIEYIGRCRKDQCLGWEAKVDAGEFGKDELQAHKDAQEMLGKHRAYAEAIKIFADLDLTPEDIKQD